MEGESLRQTRTMHTRPEAIMATTLAVPSTRRSPKQRGVHKYALDCRLVGVNTLHNVGRHVGDHASG